MNQSLQRFADRILGAEEVDRSDVSGLMTLVDDDIKTAGEFANSLRRRSYQLIREARSVARVAQAIEAHVALYVCYGDDVEF